MLMIVCDSQAFQQSALSPVEDEGEQSTAAACRALRSWGSAWALKEKRASESRAVDFAMIDACLGFDLNLYGK